MSINDKGNGIVVIGGKVGCIEELLKNMKDSPPDFAKALEDNFWDLVNDAKTNWQDMAPALPNGKEYKFAGQDCNCYAYSSSECACDADWTDPQVYRLKAEVAELKAANAKLTNTLLEAIKYMDRTGNSIIGANK